MDYDGSNRRVLLDKSHLENPQGWRDSKSTSNVSNYEVVLSQLGESLKVYSKERQEGTNACSVHHGGCKELCLFNGSSAVCACAHGQVSADGRAYKEFEAFVVYSRMTQIDSIHISDANNFNAPFPSIESKEHIRNVIGLGDDYQRRLTCSLNPDEDLKPTLLCQEEFYGVRCQTLGSDINNSSSQSSSGKSSINGTVTAIVVVFVIIAVLIPAAKAAITVMRKRRRGQPFMHVRIQSQKNVEISNPMYLREDADEDVESLDPTFMIPSNKATNFANSVYESMYNDAAAGSSVNEEKKGLLHSEPSHPLEPHKNHPLVESSESFT
ncbi:low-density lipoprotein receptor-related protein 1-like [Daphnia carinata]|uniref:low-density lipoprotein receptor-related protein 1-like n=1 Tax=Daphnia carinata TaxID=120202 RepID=UPI002868D273|nr:low-density lipoprotein receptor-related protein 1-like [Daphnia carinata]